MARLDATVAELLGDDAPLPEAAQQLQVMRRELQLLAALQKRCYLGVVQSRVPLL